MTERESQVADELIPERTNTSRVFWYLAGVGVTTFLIGVMGMLEMPAGYDGLAVGGGMILLVATLWMIFYD